MKRKTLFAILLAVVLIAASSNATIVVSPESTVGLGLSTTVDEVYYAGDVSSSDLLHGIAGTHSGFVNLNGSADYYLNDGLAGGDYDADGFDALVGAAWTKQANSVSEYVLGNGTGAGYDITEIQSIAAWVNAGLNNQHYTVSVRYLGDASYTLLTTVDYQPFGTSGTGGSSKVVITDDAGILASGIDAIRFDFLGTEGNTSYGTVYREIDVMGTATVPEPATMAMLALGGVIARFRRRR